MVTCYNTMDFTWSVEWTDRRKKDKPLKKDKRNKKITRSELNLVRLGFNEGKVWSSLEKLCRQQSICHPRTPKFLIWLRFMYFGNRINELNLAAQLLYIWKLDNLYALSISVQWAWASQINSMNIICYCSVLCCDFPSEIQGHSPLSFAPGWQEAPVLTNNRTRKNGTILRSVISFQSSPIPQKSTKCPEKHPWVISAYP